MAAKWTFLVYMAGNNSLSDDAGRDLVEMQKVGSTDDVKVLAFAKQRAGQARRIQVGKNGQGEKVESLGDDVDSGNPQTVVDFVRWGLSTAPADRYALVLWNHGGGWSPDDMDQLYTQVRNDNGVNRHELNHRASQPMARSLFSSTVKQILSQPTEAERQICNDDGTGHSLDTIELGNVLRAVTKDVGRPLDLLGMDACLMSALEVGYQAQASTRVVVGSEEVEPGAGWCYDAILGDLNARPTMDGRQLGTTVVDRYVASYRDQPGQWPVTQCALDASQLTKFAGALDGLVGALSPRLSNDWLQVYRAQLKSVGFHSQLRDLRTFCRQLSLSPLSAEAKAAAKNVVDALKPGGFVINEGHLGAGVDGCGGVTAYFPTPSEPISPYYRDLRFSKVHRWAPFLKSYQRAARTG